MTSYVWKGTSATDHNGAWGVAADWTAAGVPAAGDTAVINATGSYKVTTNTTGVTGVGTLVLNAVGATLEVASTINIGSSLDVQAGTISMLANTALISSAGTGAVTIEAGATLAQTVPDTSVTGPSVAYIGTPFTNNGTVLLVNTGGLFLADPSSPYQLSANATNNGTILVSNSNLIVRSATLDGTGIIVLSNNSYVEISGTTAATAGGRGTIQFTDGLTNALEFDTLGTIAPVIDGFQSGDIINFYGLTYDPADRITFDGTTLQVIQNGTAVIQMTMSNVQAGVQFQLQADTDLWGGTDIVACYAAGTRIMTERGEVAIEDLREADRVVALHPGRTAPVRWIGWRDIDLRDHPRPWDVQPVRVRAHAFGEGRPRRDLVLSPDHAVFLDGVLIPVRYLLNDTTIVQENRAEATWYHVELDRHAVILAEGLAAESYLDTGNRGAYANGGAPRVDPDHARAVWASEACAPLVLEGPRLVSARELLLARAQELGHMMTEDPGLRILAGGTEVPVMRDGARWVARLPTGTNAVRMQSRSARPACTKPDSDDHRILGVAVTALTLDRQQPPAEAFGRGWHAPEPGLRWADGDALLETRGARLLELTLAPSCATGRNPISAGRPDPPGGAAVVLASHGRMTGDQRSLYVPASLAPRPPGFASDRRASLYHLQSRPGDCAMQSRHCRRFSRAERAARVHAGRMAQAHHRHTRRARRKASQPAGGALRRQPDRAPVERKADARPRTLREIPRPDHHHLAGRTRRGEPGRAFLWWDCAARRDQCPLCPKGDREGRGRADRRCRRRRRTCGHDLSLRAGAGDSRLV
jgi:hypothetical protein